MKPRIQNIFLCAAAFAIAGCASSHFPHATPSGDVRAVARLANTQGHDVRGTVVFIQSRDGVFITANVRGLTPGEHGFHIHEKGDCSAPDASSAGGHFNPTHAPHGGPHSAQRHVGDFGNLVANARGDAHLEVLLTGVSLTGSNSIIGRAVIVHEKADDLKSQPSGNAGARVACGVIEKQ